MLGADINSQTNINQSLPTGESYFSRLFGGRLGRASYLYGMLWATLVAPLIVFGLSFLLKLVGLPESILITIAWLLFPVWILYIFSFFIRRLHDFNKSGWLALLALIPIVTIIFGLFLLFKKGDEAANNYGSPPKSKIDARLTFGIKPKPGALS